MTQQALQRIRHDVEQWTNLQLSEHPGLFAPQLAPPGGTLYDILSKALHEHADFESAQVASQVRTACEYAVARRRHLLEQVGSRSTFESNGRWLIFRPALVDFCGLSADKGFVDNADAPAWDLWVSWSSPNVGRIPFASQQLVSWVPASLVERFDEAVRCSVLNALTWNE